MEQMVKAVSGIGLEEGDGVEGSLVNLWVETFRDEEGMFPFQRFQRWVSCQGLGNELLVLVVEQLRAAGFGDAKDSVVCRAGGESGGGVGLISVDGDVSFVFVGGGEEVTFQQQDSRDVGILEGNHAGGVGEFTMLPGSDDNGMGSKVFDFVLYGFRLGGDACQDEDGGETQECGNKHSCRGGKFVFCQPAEGIFKQIGGYPVRRFHRQCRPGVGRGN